MLYSSLLQSVSDVSSVFRGAVSHGQRLWNCWRLCCVELSGGMDIMQLFSAFRFRQFLGTHFNPAAALVFPGCAAQGFGIAGDCAVSSVLGA